MRVLTDVFDRKLIQQTEKSGYSNYAGSAFKHLVVVALTLPKVDPYACTTTEWNPKSQIWGSGEDMDSKIKLIE